jgi:hypothetical protein
MPSNSDLQRAAASGRSAALARRRARWLILVLASLLIAVSCVESAPAGPVSALVPGDAIVAVFVESPYKLYSSMDELWRSAGLAASFGGDFESLVKKSAPLDEEQTNLLDFARPWAFALLPASAGSSETRSVLYIPLRGQSDKLAELGGDSMKLVKQAKGYAVFASGSGELAFPPAQPLDVSRLARYPASAIKIWADPKAVLRITKNGFKPIAGSARRFVTGEAEGMDAATEALKEAAMALWDELRSADAAIVPGPDGLSLRFGLTARPAGFAEKALARAAAGSSALEWADHVDAEALYGCAWSCDPALAAELSSSIVKPLFSAIGLPEEVAASIARLEERWASASGPRGAVSFDMGLDLSAAKELAGKDQASIAEAIEKAFDFEIESIYEVRDDARYRELVRGMASDPDFKALASAYSDKLGIEFSLENEDKSDGSFGYGVLKPIVKISDPKKLGMGEEAGAGAAALDAMMGKMQFAWAVADGRMAMCSGDAAALRDLLARKAAPHSLSADPRFSAFAKTLPPKPLFVGSLSLRRIIEIVSDVQKDMAEPGAADTKTFDASRFGSWYSYAAVDGANGSYSLEFGVHVPAGDLGALAGLGASLGAKEP